MILTNYWWLDSVADSDGADSCTDTAKNRGVCIRHHPGTLAPGCCMDTCSALYFLVHEPFRVCGYRSVQKYVFGSTVAGISIHKLFIRAYQGSWLFYPHLASETLDRQ